MSEAKLILIMSHFKPREALQAPLCFPAFIPLDSNGGARGLVGAVGLSQVTTHSFRDWTEFGNEALRPFSGRWLNDFLYPGPQEEKLKKLSSLFSFSLIHFHKFESLGHCCTIVDLIVLIVWAHLYFNVLIGRAPVPPCLPWEPVSS